MIYLDLSQNYRGGHFWKVREHINNFVVQKEQLIFIFLYTGKSNYLKRMKKRNDKRKHLLYLKINRMIHVENILIL